MKKSEFKKAEKREQMRIFDRENEIIFSKESQEQISLFFEKKGMNNGHNGELIRAILCGAAKQIMHSNRYTSNRLTYSLTFLHDTQGLAALYCDYMLTFDIIIILEDVYIVENLRLNRLSNSTLNAIK
ncbi:MAG: hypothetical protein ACRCWQ_01540 [Bacilli bacterium]